MNTFCRRLVSALAVALCALAAYAGTVNPEAFTNALLRGVTGKNVYSVGEAAKFTLSLQDAE